MSRWLLLLGPLLLGCSGGLRVGAFTEPGDDAASASLKIDPGCNTFSDGPLRFRIANCGNAPTARLQARITAGLEITTDGCTALTLDPGSLCEVWVDQFATTLSTDGQLTVEDDAQRVAATIPASGVCDSDGGDTTASADASAGAICGGGP